MSNIEQYNKVAVELAIWHRTSLSRNSLLLLNLKICYCSHTSPQINPILSQFTSSQPICWRSTLILLIHAKDSMFYQNHKFQCISQLPHVYYNPQTFHPAWLHNPNNIRQKVQITGWSISLHSSFIPSVISLPLGQNIPFSTLFSNTLKLLSTVCENKFCSYHFRTFYLPIVFLKIKH